MKTLASLTAMLLTLILLAPGSAGAEDSKATEDSKAKQGARQVESGAKQVGVGKTVVGGAETAGEKIKEAGEAAKPEAKTAWGNVRDGATAFGHSVKTFFTRPFRSSSEQKEEKGRSGS